jgi:threonine dehydrogenase-like Zn-dependent dehydrogenase
MRATVMFGAGDVRIQDVRDARLIEPTDAVVRVTRACICGSDLWPYGTLEPSETGLRMGHEAMRPSPPRSAPGSPWPSSVTGRSVCAA